MSWGTAFGVRCVLTSTAAAVTFIGVAVTGAVVPANATPGFAGMSRTPAPLDPPDPNLPTNPNDPRCAGAFSSLAQCQGGPFAAGGAPTGPADPQCITMPADPVCAGGPYALPAPAAIPSPPPAAAPIDRPDVPIYRPHVPEEHFGGGMPGHG
jgi:hypothetical protein